MVGLVFLYKYTSCNLLSISFILFEKAEEMEQLIVGVISDDLNCLIEVTVENMQYALKDIDINEAKDCCYDYAVPRLVQNLEVLNQEYQKGAEKLDKIFQALSYILPDEK